MLILNIKQVKVCRLLRQKKDTEEIIRGISYKGGLFVEVESYDKEQRQIAMQRCRDLFLDNKTEIASLIIEEENKISLWSEDKQVKLIEDDQENIYNTIAQINLEQLVTKMRNIGGITIKDRWYNLKVYPRCFIGKEAVDWLSDNYQISRPEAVKLGQRLMDKKWIHHVVDDRAFQDGHFFYRFYWDEQ